MNLDGVSIEISTNHEKPPPRLLVKPHSARRASREEPRKKTETNNSDNVVTQIRTGLKQIEWKLDKTWRMFEERQKQDANSETRDANISVTADTGALFDDLKRIETKAENILKKSLTANAERKKKQKILDEVQLERDVLLEKVHSYLEQISSLRSKIEEQRCSIGAYERKINAEYEIQIRKLESVNEDLRNAANQKEKQLKDANEQMRQLQNTVRSYETLSWRKKNEERVFISILKNDLQTIWNEKIKMEEEFKRMKRLCGYTEQDIQPRTFSDDYIGTFLRRSKSMSDLTIPANNSVVEFERESVSPTTVSNTQSFQGECASVFSSISRRKIFQELIEIEKKLSDQTAEVKKLKEEEKKEAISTILEKVTAKMEDLKGQLKTYDV